MSPREHCGEAVCGIDHNLGVVTLRNQRIFTRLVLSWFLLFVGAATASTLVRPANWQAVCTASGATEWVDVADGGTPAAVVNHHLLDCPTCLPLLGPVPTGASLPCQAQPPAARQVFLLQPARVAQRAAAPLPARGPPLSL